jgi:excisionase family DNA binding protein
MHHKYAEDHRSPNKASLIQGPYRREHEVPGRAKEVLSYSPSTNGHSRSLLTVAEFHEHFRPKIGRNKVYELVQTGRLKSLRLGERKILIPATELYDWPARELERVQ